MATAALTLSRTVDMTGMQKMAKMMWAPMLMMGVMLVGSAVIIGAFNADNVSEYFQLDKATRDAADSGTAIVGNRQAFETIQAWLPGYTFLGMGFLLSGITFALATILGTLRVAGGSVQKSLGVDAVLPKPPLSVMGMPLFAPLMMMGLLVLVSAFGVHIWLASETHDLFGHSIAEIDAATAGSPLLGQLSSIQSTKAWLEPLKFVGISLLLAGITTALFTIILALREQSRRLTEVLES